MKCTSPIITAPVRSMINRNMRCIEISAAAAMLRALIRINRNMRCIEMQVILDSLTTHDAINRNMRCIEIDVPYPS